MAAAAAVAGTTVSTVSRAIHTVKPLGNRYTLTLGGLSASRRCSSMAAAGAPGSSVCTAAQFEAARPQLVMQLLKQ